MDQKKGYYAIIPADVRYDEELPPNAKLLYGEITALSDKEGICWASNEYFARLYGMTKQSISRLIKILSYKGYIMVNIQYKEGSREIQRRCISIVNTYKQKCDDTINNFVTPYKQNCDDPINKNVKENNTSINNTINNTSINNKKESKKETGYDKILSVIEDDGLRELYYDYIKMRQRTKSPMTDRALKILIGRVNALESKVERKKKLLEAAILNNWRSVYPLKAADKPEDKTNDKYVEAMEKIRARQRRGESG